MQQHQKKIIGLIAGIFCILFIGLFFWLKPNSPQDSSEETPAIAVTNNIDTAASTVDTHTSGSLMSESQKDTQINCQIRTDASNRLIVNEQTKDCFEYFITQYGEKNIEQIKADFLTYTKANYKEPVMSQLSDLWTRYIQYREQLGHLQPPEIANHDANQQNNPKYYREILGSTKALRKKFFSDYEIEGLFGTQDTYDTYTINRMEILNDKTLSASEKAEKLKDLFNQLPQDWKENLEQINQLEDLRKLTAEIKARGGSAAEIREMRTNLVGAEATQRLENLDTRRSEWKNQVNQFLTERDSIMNSSMSDSAKQSAVEQLRHQQFNTPQERIRIETFEQIHDQGGTLPFGE